MSARAGAALPEVWGGIEATVNRVGDRWFDQCVRSGHHDRADDLDRFAALGIRAIRYPVLWERVAPAEIRSADWRRPDAAFGQLRALGVRPIAGLVHHGSGPPGTSLVDPAFPERLAAYARAVAERYPWIEDWTPVNEPLTTARFSGLYGHWYPHGRDDRTFVRALLTQVRGVVLAMAAIRAVRPAARLVQTDDMGRTTSTPPLVYQAELEQERRWLAFDLLCGRVGETHPLHAYLRGAGASEAELEFFREHPTPPGVVGLNYYVTSDRHLDHRQERYPPWTRGGNGRDAYADVESARVPVGAAGHRAVLASAWERYGLPVALTEVHLGGPREEQLRWLGEAWDACVGLRSEGADVRALTVWSLLGAFDWNVLVTAENGFYEPGPFDVRGPRPRPTALAAMTRALARVGSYEHPVLAAQGWWRRPERLFPGCEGDAAGSASPGRRGAARPPEPRPILVLGATGTLGRAFSRICHDRGLTHALLGRSDLDLCARASIAAALERHRPWAVVNAAGYVRVDDAEREQERCWRENAEGAGHLAEACAARGVPLVTFSSDLVFDGGLDRPYVETDRVAPRNAYGRSKAEAEQRVLSEHPGALVVRTSAFFGPWDPHNFVTVALAALRAREPFLAAEDQVVSPTYVPDLVHAALDLLVDGEAGIWHLANAGAISWADLARTAARLAGLDPAGVSAVPTAALRLPAARPRFSALASERGTLLPPLETALGRYLLDRTGPQVAGGGRVACPECGGALGAEPRDGRCRSHREHRERPRGAEVG